MLFTEVKNKYRKLGTFNNFITISEAKSLGVIPEKYHSYFPNLCECGSENIITMDLQQPQCCDPRCEIKQSYALAELLDRYDCNGLGPAKCLKIYEALKPRFKLNSYMECLMVDYNDYPIDIIEYAYAADFYEASVKIQTTQVIFAELISKLGIPSISGKALQLFDGINTFDEFVEKVNSEGGLISYCAKRGIRDKMLIFWLKEYATEIALASNICNACIRPAGIVKQVICITGSIILDGVRMTKKEFIKYCNDLTRTEDGVQLLEIVMNSGKATASHIIADSTANTAKYVAGKNRGIETDIDGVKRKVLMTSAEYVDSIKEICEKWKNSLQKDLQNCSKKEEKSLQQESSQNLTVSQISTMNHLTNSEKNSEECQQMKEF